MTYGPLWLRLAKTDWPTPVILSPAGCLPERRVDKTAHSVAPKEPWDLASRFSSWPKLLRVSAYIMRFVSRSRSRSPLPASRGDGSISLSAREIESARTLWLTYIQRKSFPIEQKSLRTGKPLSFKSGLISLNPFLDEDKLIRVGRRLAHAPLPLCAKHPILLALPGNSINCATRSFAVPPRRNSVNAQYVATRVLADSRPQFGKGRYPQMRCLRSRASCDSDAAYGESAPGPHFASVACLFKLWS